MYRLSLTSFFSSLAHFGGQLSSTYQWSLQQWLWCSDVLKLPQTWHVPNLLISSPIKYFFPLCFHLGWQQPPCPSFPGPKLWESALMALSLTLHIQSTISSFFKTYPGYSYFWPPSLTLLWWSCETLSSFLDYCNNFLNGILPFVLTLFSRLCVTLKFVSRGCQVPSLFCVAPSNSFLLRGKVKSL